MLEMFQKNPPLLQTKMMMQMTPGQRPPMPQGQVNVGPLTQDSTTTPAQQQPQAAPKFQLSPLSQRQGFTSQEVVHKGNTVHVVADPNGNPVNVFNPDGTVYNGGQ